MSKQGAFKKLYKRFEIPIKYALFGIGTGVINFGIFLIGTEFAHDPNRVFLSLQWWQIVNLLAWLCANAYSFYVNRRFVFKSRSQSFGALMREIAVFFGIRFVSFFISTYIMFHIINKFELDHQIAKMAGVVIEVALNYFNCKLFVFRNKKAK